MIEPNWDYFCNAPLDQGVIRFETKTERALHAKVVATEANWMEYQSHERLTKLWEAKKDLEAFQQGRGVRRNMGKTWKITDQYLNQHTKRRLHQLQFLHKQYNTKNWSISIDHETLLE